MRRIALFFLLLLAVAGMPAIADTNLLLGVWQGGDRWTEAAYPFTKISTSNIQFSVDGKNWECPIPYTVIDSGNGDTYPGNVMNIRKERTYHFVKIKMARTKCTTVSKFLLFAIPSDIADYVDFVEFRGEMPDGRGHFYKRNDLK
jgi:hypothetical protein